MKAHTTWLSLVAALVLFGCQDNGADTLGPDSAVLSPAKCNPNSNNPNCDPPPEEELAYEVTFSSVGAADPEVLTTATCGPGFLVARAPGGDAFSLRVDPTSRMEFDDTLYPFLLEFDGVNVTWERVHDVTKGLTGNFGRDFTEEGDSPCYGQTPEDHRLVGNLLLDIHEGRGKPSERRQHVHFHLVYDAFCDPSDDPTPADCSTLEDFILSEGAGELEIVPDPRGVIAFDPNPFDPVDGGTAVVEGMMEFEYFLTDLGREPIEGGGPMPFRFVITIEPVDPATL